MNRQSKLSTANRKFKIAYVLLFLILTAAGCGKDDKTKAPPAVPVTVAEVTSETVPVYLNYVGTTQSVQSVNIYARVEGFLIERAFKDGADVKQGDLLFVIDPRPFEADLDAAKAQLAEDRAALTYAREQVRRYKPLVDKDYITKDAYDDFVTNAAEAQAAVEADIANVTQAKLNLSYCTMYAPFDGRIGRRYVDVGNLVGAGGQATELATIVQLDPMYVYFSVAERDVPKVLREQSKKPLTVGIILPDETRHPEPGTVDFLNNEVDINTGTMEMRAVVPNSEEDILPGQYVKVQLLLSEQPGAILVPEQAVGDQQGQNYVIVVGKDNKAEFRNVKIGADYKGSTIVEKGVKVGEKVVIEGLQKLRPGMSVEPKPAKPKSTNGPAPTPATGGKQ